MCHFKISNGCLDVTNLRIFFFAGEIDKVKRTIETSVRVFIFLNINDNITKHLFFVSSHINRNGIFFSFCFDFVQLAKFTAEIKFINSFFLGFCLSYLLNYSVLKSV